MLGTRRALCLLALSPPFFLGSCAEGTKVDVPEGPGGVGNLAFGGAGGAKGSGTMVAALGGVPNKSGTQGRLSSAGTTNSGVAQGGKGGHLGVGGMILGSAGATGMLAMGGVAIATVSAPTSGPAIRILQQKLSASQSETSTDFVLVNVGPAALDLTTVTVRYYFTIDVWATPVFEIDYAGQLIAKSDIKYSLFTVEPSRDGADRYFEISFTKGNIPAAGEIQITSRLHEQTWRTMTATNDYSFIGGAGFTDRMTIFLGHQLVWGTEPPAIAIPGAGGASGSAGASGTVSPAGGSRDGAAGGLGLAGVAGSF